MGCFSLSKLLQSRSRQRTRRPAVSNGRVEQPLPVVTLSPVASVGNGRDERHEPGPSRSNSALAVPEKSQAPEGHLLETPMIRPVAAREEAPISQEASSSSRTLEWLNSHDVGDSALNEEEAETAVNSNEPESLSQVPQQSPPPSPTGPALTLLRSSLASSAQGQVNAPRIPSIQSTEVGLPGDDGATTRRVRSRLPEAVQTVAVVVITASVVRFQPMICAT